MAEKKSLKDAVAEKKATKKPTSKKKTETVNPIENILNPENNQNIVLFDEEGNPGEFEQVALIPYNEELYCILRPIIPFEDMQEDEGIVFKIMEAPQTGLYLDIVSDDETVDAIFDIYGELFEEAQGNL